MLRLMRSRPRRGSSLCSRKPLGLSAEICCAGDRDPVPLESSWRCAEVDWSARRRAPKQMLKILGWVSLIGLVGILLVAVVAPTTPDGSWLHEFGEDVLDSIGSVWGNPVTVE